MNKIMILISLAFLGSANANADEKHFFKFTASNAEQKELVIHKVLDPDAKKTVSMVVCNSSVTTDFYVYGSSAEGDHLTTGHASPSPSCVSVTTTRDIKIVAVGGHDNDTFFGYFYLVK